MLPPQLEAALRHAHESGFFGEGPIDLQVRHAEGFRWAALAAGWDGPQEKPASFIDLGSGGGLPGLILAAVWPSSSAVLLDSSQRRTEALERAVEALGWLGRVRVLRARAEEAGREVALRGSQPLVVARSFGPPGVVAECAAPFLEVGGILVVSEPPLPEDAHGDMEGGSVVVGHLERWPAAPLAELGLEVGGFYRGEFGYQILRQITPCPERYPRRVGVPGKRPLF